MSSPLVERLDRVAGPTLGTVDRYGDGGIEAVYEGVDISQKERVIDNSYQELVLQELGRTYLEHPFQVGRRHCTMRRFERAVCIHHARGKFSGTLVSVDTGADANPDRLADICHEHADWPPPLTSGVAPR
jgi:hypothetical protein